MVFKKIGGELTQSVFGGRHPTANRVRKNDPQFRRFIRTVASQVVVGLFRASALTPAQLFFAHVDHADIAAHIAMADSMLREPHGSPLLLEMARHVGEAVFGDNLETLAQAAYAAAGAPWRYRTNRTR